MLLVSTAVTSVNVRSFPNASILVSWKPPKHMLKKLFQYSIAITNESSFRNNHFVLGPPSEVKLPNIVTTNASTLFTLFDGPNRGVSGASYAISIIPQAFQSCYGIQ